MTKLVRSTAFDSTGRPSAEIVADRQQPVSGTRLAKPASTTPGIARIASTSLFWNTVRRASSDAADSAIVIENVST